MGFYAGDMARKLVISQRSELQAKNIFRIDGKQVDISYTFIRFYSFAMHIIIIIMINDFVFISSR